MTWEELLQSQQQELETLRVKWKDKLNQLRAEHKEIFDHTSFTSGKASQFLLRAVKSELDACLRDANREREDLQYAHDVAQEDYLKTVGAEQSFAQLFQKPKERDRGR